MFVQGKHAIVLCVDIIKAIEEARTKRLQANNDARALDEQMAELIRAAFQQGYSGPAIAKAAGLSKPRVYQIRNGRR